MELIYNQGVLPTTELIMLLHTKYYILFVSHAIIEIFGKFWKEY